MKEMPKTIEELNRFIKNYIKDNLSIEIEEESNYYGEGSVNSIKLILNGECISTDYF